MLNYESYEENSEVSDEDSEILELEHKALSGSEVPSNKKMRELLPIKTSAGVVLRSQEVQKKVEVVDESMDESDEIAEQQPIDEMDVDSDIDVLEDVSKALFSQFDNFYINKFFQKRVPKKAPKKTKLTAAELLAEREQEVQRQRFRIGVICTGLLEKPEEKVKNLGVLLSLLNPYGSDKELNLLSTRKLAMISLSEVFKDILPEYRVGVVDLQNQKVKKDTLNRITYENSMLNFYKKYLKALEDFVKAFQNRKFGPKPTKEKLALAELAIQCMCELLLAHPYFNYSTNVAQLLVVLLNSSRENVRTLINKTFVKIFKTDKRMDLTLHVSHLCCIFNYII